MRLRRLLAEGAIVPEADLAAVDAEVAAEIEAAVAAARAAPDPAPETLTTDVYVTYGAA